MPGVAVGVRAPGADCALGIGLADVEAHQPVTADTAFGVGSVTKLFVATAVMQLVEEEAIALDDPVNTHLRAFRVEPPTSDDPAVTVRHLLTHSAGIGELHRVSDLLKPYAGFGVRPGRPVPSLRQLYGPVFRPAVGAGSKWAYANHGFAILGQLVEDVRRSPLRAVVQERFIDPMGLTRTDLGRTERVSTGPVARGYKPRAQPRPALDVEPTVPAAGGAWSTASDLLRFGEALLAGGRVVSRETLELMWQPHVRIDPRLPGRGLGFHLGALGDHRVVGHDGLVPGFSTTVLVAPTASAAAVVLANAGSLGISAQVHSLARALLGSALGVPDPLGSLPVAVPERPDRWRQLSGIHVPEPGLLTSLRAYWSGAVFVVRPDRTHSHLTLRTLAGAGRRPARLHPADPDDPELFRFVGRAGLVSDVAFSPGRLSIASPMGAFLRLRRVGREGTGRRARR